jgi:tetratricopeptide (TPR) repeat protein
VLVRWFSAFFAVLIGTAAAAAAAGSLDAYREDWLSDLATGGLRPEQVVYPFSVTPEMVEWAEEQISNRSALSSLERLTVLQEALFGWKDEGFQYDESLTLTAQQAFSLRRGNCMSFTALFIGLGRSVGVPMSLVSVEKAPGVDREDNLVVVNRHVVAGYQEPGSLVLFDFNLTSEAPVARHEIVSDLVASAMYHANLGGAAIRSGDLDVAARHLELSTRLAPDWAPGWVNLGVVRFRQGRTDDALRAYGAALEAEPGNSSAFANIAVAHRSNGNHDAARAALEAATRSTATPYTLIAMAERWRTSRSRTVISPPPAPICAERGGGTRTFRRSLTPWPASRPPRATAIAPGAI